jgi:hypothetical protein
MEKESITSSSSQVIRFCRSLYGYFHDMIGFVVGVVVAVAMKCQDFPLMRLPCANISLVLLSRHSCIVQLYIAFAAADIFAITDP